MKLYYQKKREELLAYAATYRANHKEEIAAYRKEHKDERAEYDREWRKNNPDYHKKHSKAYYAEHREELLSHADAYRAANKDEIAAYNAAYFASKHGRAVMLVNAYNRRDKNRGLDISQNIDAAWMEENVFNGQVCYYCGESDWHLLGADRINNKVGHIPSNVVPCCQRCNETRQNSKSSVLFKAIMENKKGDA